jgi:glycosyltransferase involved in cell wall biosynthesis
MVANWLLLERRDRVVGVGESVRQALVRNEGIPSRRVAVVYNGVDLSTFDDRHADRASVRREVRVGPDHLVIIQVARLDALKDHATAIRTLQHVVRHRPDATLVLVGEGPEEGLIRDEVRERGLESRVLFLGLRGDVARLLLAADLFLLTSISEGIPVTLIEAMGAARPVVATRVGGVGEVVEDGVTGLLAPAGDDEALGRHILHLAADPDGRGRMGQLGRERALALFSEERMHEGYLRLYEEMLDG